MDKAFQDARQKYLVVAYAYHHVDQAWKWLDHSSCSQHKDERTQVGMTRVRLQILLREVEGKWREAGATDEQVQHLFKFTRR